MRKKFFNWTPQDVADWEKIRSTGLLRFIFSYGLMLFGGILFVLLAGATALLVWRKSQAPNLIPELVAIALICLLGGLVNSLITWWVEERMYRKFKKIHSPAHRPAAVSLRERARRFKKCFLSVLPWAPPARAGVRSPQ